MSNTWQIRTLDRESKANGRDQQIILASFPVYVIAFWLKGPLNSHSKCQSNVRTEQRYFYTFRVSKNYLLHIFLGSSFWNHFTKMRVSNARERLGIQRIENPNE